MFDVFVAAADRGSILNLKRMSFEELVRRLLAGEKIEGELFLGKALYDNRIPATGGYPHLLAWGLEGMEWKQYSFPLFSTDLDMARAVLKNLPEADKRPVGNTPERLKELFAFFRRRRVMADIFTKGNSINCTLVRDQQVIFDHAASRLGITHLDGEKTEKRASQLGRNFLVASRILASHLTFTIIEDKALAKALDGTVTMSRRFFDSVMKDNPAAKDFESIKTLNFRAWIPGLGLVKAMALVAESLPGDVDLVFHRINVKDKEVRVDGEFAYVGWDPQGAKPCAYTDRQSLQNFGWFWGLGRKHPKTSRVYAWVDEDLRDVVRCANAGVTPEEERLLLQLAQFEKRIEKSFTTKERLDAIDWLRVGTGRQAELPRLFRNSVNNHLERICSSEWKEREVRVKIPGSFFAQIVSMEAVKHIAPRLAMAGLAYGKVFYLESHQIFVVSNKFWEDNLRNWGGCDLDDKFRLIFRRHLGTVKVFIYRTPCDRNEYALAEVYGHLPPLQGDWESEPWLCPKSRPKQMSNLKGVRPTLAGSPKQAGSKPGKRTFETVMAKVGMPSNPGWAINIISLWNTGYEKVCPLPPMESIVDLCTAEKDAQRLEALTSLCVSLVEEMAADLQAGRVKLDANLARSVFGVAKGYGVEVRIEESSLCLSPYSRLCELVHGDVVAQQDWFKQLMPDLCRKAWSDKLPKLKGFMAYTRKRYGNKAMNIVVERVNRVFRGWSSAYKSELLKPFRVGKRMVSMGFEIVARDQAKLVGEQVRYLWRLFRRRFRIRFRDFARILVMVALHQLFGQADKDSPKPVIDLNGRLEEGSPITDLRWFGLFLKVRSRF